MADTLDKTHMRLALLQDFDPTTDPVPMGFAMPLYQTAQRVIFGCPYEVVHAVRDGRMRLAVAEAMIGLPNARQIEMLHAGTALSYAEAKWAAERARAEQIKASPKNRSGILRRLIARITGSGTVE